MEEAGHSVISVHVSRDVLPVIREGGIDAVLIDAYDPRVGIVELSKAIALLHEAPPIALISSSPAAPELSARIGAAAFVMKPCDPSEVVAVANRLVGDVRRVRFVEDDPTIPSRTRF